MPSPQKKDFTQIFTGGINADLAPESMQPGMYRHALNIRVLSTASGNKGIVTNVKGTVEIEYELPDGENFTLGRREDTESGRFYWLNWNSNGYHGIYFYDQLLNSVTRVLLNLTDTAGVDILQLKRRSLILHIDVVRSPDGKDLVYWVDGQVKPKKINIQKALDKSTAGYGVTILPEYINAYKLAAIFPPSTNYFTDVTRLTNYLYGHLFKATVRHWFDDGEKNNWSEFSTVALPQNESFSGNAAISNVNNALDITVETGSSIVTHIEIGIKNGSGDFVSVAVLEKAKLGISDNSTYTYRFYNDSSTYSGLDPLNVYRAYSFLPRLAALQAFTKNSMVYGKGIEGFEAVTINASTDVSYSDLFLPPDTVPTMNEPSIVAQMLNFHYKSGRRWSWNQITIGHDVKKGNFYTLYANNGESDSLKWEYEANITDDAVSVANAFKQKLTTSTDRVFSTAPDFDDTHNIWDNTVNGDGDVTFSFYFKGRYSENVTDFGYIPATVTPVSTQTLKDTGISVGVHKSGGTVKYGIIYWDEDTRRSNVYTDDSLVVHTDFVTETSGYKKVIHELTVKHVPPIWGKYWEIVRCVDLTYGTGFIHILIQRAIESQSVTNTDYVDLVIGSLYTYQKMYPNTVIKYEFEKNDRVRLINKYDVDGNKVYYPFIETVVLDFKEVGTTETITEDVTTNNTNIVTIGGVANADNVGRYISIDGVERLITSTAGATYTLDRTFGTALKYTSFKIVDKRGIIRVRKPVGVTIDDNSIVEVYKPTESVATAEKQFFLFGQKYAIVNPGTDERAHTGNVQNQDPDNPTTTPAIVNISKGTTYVRTRQLPTNNQIPGTQVILDLVEDKNYSDAYESDLNDNGKIAPEDDGSGEKRFGSRLRYSSRYIEGTKINGLNDFDNLNRKDYNDPYGDFMLLKFREGLLYAFKQLKDGYIPILARIIRSNDGDEILGASNELLNDFQPFAWEGGIGNNPESYTSNQTWQWHISPNSGVMCRIGGDGILPVSKQFGLDSKTREYINNAVKYSTFIQGGFERDSDEVVWNFENYNEYQYNAGFDEANWELFDDALPEGTEYEITTQPTHGDAVIDSSDDFTTYTPDTDYVGSDPLYFRWKVPGGAWTTPKKVCLTVKEVPIPSEPTIYYNEELIVSFTKDDCAEGYHGSEVDYTVLALTYSSPFSQDDADQQAQDDADTNGQAYANANGTCLLNAPPSFNFTDVTGAPLDTLTESNAIVPGGTYDNYIISVSGGEYQINGGAWVSTPGVILKTDSIKLRRTSSDENDETVSVTLIIGGVSDTWDITTIAETTYNTINVRYGQIDAGDVCAIDVREVYLETPNTDIITGITVYADNDDGIEPLTGMSFIVDLSGAIYDIDPDTGVVGEPTGYTCSDIPLEDFDFMVLTYGWESGSGTDLDTYTGFIGTGTIYDGDPGSRTNWVGFNQNPIPPATTGSPPANRLIPQGSSTPYLNWGTDNTGSSGIESILIDMKQFILDFPATPNPVEVQANAVWYNTVLTGDITVGVKTYKGGTMSLVGTDFVNTGGVAVADISLPFNVPIQDSTTLIANSTPVAILSFDKTTNTASLTLQ